MYLTFFGLKEPPFNLTPDSRFFFLSRKHREALASLVYGIEERKGFIAITGEIGSGKTTLCRSLINELNPENTRIAVIFNSNLNELELLQNINEDLGIRADFTSNKDLIRELNEFLIRETNAGISVILIIDEAQNLSLQALEQIRMLGNLETETDKLIQIILLGQPELLDKLHMPEMEQLDQRISVRYHIRPLDKEEVSEYIQHRINVAQAQIEIEFTPQALKKIYEYSGGIPRKLNILCDRCLLDAYSKVSYTIDENIVKEAISEVKGEKDSPPISRASRRSPSFLKTRDILLLIPVFFLVISGGIYLGFRLAAQNKTSSPIRSLNESSESVPPDISNIPADSVPSGESANLNKPTMTPVEPEKTQVDSTPAKKTYYLFDWQYDNDNICRVNNPDFAYPAAIISWLRLWNIEVELDEFRSVDPSTVKKLDLTKTGKPGLQKFMIGEDFPRALRYDSPFILILKDPPEKLSHAILLIRAEGISFTIADPLWGMKTVKKSYLEKHISQCLMLYFDSLGLDKIRTGEGSDRVRTLQTQLQKEEVFNGSLTGVFDEKTVRAVRNLQVKYRINATGYLDGETVFLLSLNLSDARPRLYPTTGEK
jgi:general secretion pathway protein A